MSTFDNADFRGLEMAFGGSNTLPAAQIGWTDENNIAYFDGSAWQETSLSFDPMSFDGVGILINTLTDTWDLVVERFDNGYVQETVVSGLALANDIDSDFGDITWTVNTDVDDAGTADDNGLAKTYFDNFTFDVTPVPEPSVALLGVFGLMGLFIRRR